MRNHLSTIAAACLLAALTSTAFAEDPDPSGQYAMQVNSDLTRAQVEAQTMAAIRAGDISVPGNLFTKRDVTPGAYAPKPQAVAGKSRAQVEAELADAIHEGNMFAAGESGMTERQLNPTFYAARDEAEHADQFASAPSN